MTPVIGVGCHGAAGATITNTACPQRGTGLSSVTVSPVTAPFLALYPIPNLPNNNYTFPYSQTEKQRFAAERRCYTSGDTGSFWPSRGYLYLCLLKIRSGMKSDRFWLRINPGARLYGLRFGVLKRIGFDQ